VSGTLIVNEELPRPLRRKIEAEAKRSDVTLNDVAGRVLAEHYGLEWEDSGNSFQPTGARFRFSVPDEMHRLISGEAAHKLGTMRGVVLSTLAAHFGTKPIAVGRKPRGGK
jgi:hypothetical protein